jgi:hypothetical protein
MSNFRIKEIARIKEFYPVSFIKRGSTLTRSILCYAKMKRSPISPVDVVRMFGFRCRRPYDAREVMKTLEGRGMLRHVDADTWEITPTGINAIYLLGKRDEEYVGGDFSSF